MEKKVTKLAAKAATAYGKLGGKATLKKHGKDHFRNIAKKRWAKQKKQ